jgi:hypothetical protein
MSDTWSIWNLGRRIARIEREVEDLKKPKELASKGGPEDSWCWSYLSPEEKKRWKREGRAPSDW